MRGSVVVRLGVGRADKRSLRQRLTYLLGRCSQTDVCVQLPEGHSASSWYTEPT